MFKTGRKTSTVFENEVVEFVQGIAGEGVPIIEDDRYNVYMNGKRIGCVFITRLDKGAARLKEEISETFFGKFNRMLRFSGNNIYVSEVMA